VDGEELPAAEAEDLEKEFNKESESPLQNEDFMPGKPVKLNEAWEVDTDRVVKTFEAEAPFKLDKDKSKVTGKLTRVYSKDGAQFGMIELTMTLVTTALKQGGQEIELKEGSKITAKIDLDVCIDGSRSDGAAAVAMGIDIKADIAGGSMVITGKTSGKSAAKQVGKK
jgi:hypothetical protein